MSMRTNKRTEITIETARLLVISNKTQSARVWCESCGRRVAMVTADVAARLARVSSRTIYRWVETGKLHFAETSEGQLLVCHESIPLPEPFAQ